MHTINHYKQYGNECATALQQFHGCWKTMIIFEVLFWLLIASEQTIT